MSENHFWPQHDSDEESQDSNQSSSLSKENDQYKLQRRKQIRALEQKRRSRINDLLKDLEGLVFDNKTERRITKEEILQQAISIISNNKEKQKEPEPPRSEVLSNITYSSVGGSLVPLSDNTIKFILPELTTDQTEITFRVIFVRVFTFLKNIQHHSDKQHVLSLIQEMEHLSSLIGKIELQLRVCVLRMLVSGIHDYHPGEAEKANNYALFLYKKLLPGQRIMLQDFPPFSEVGTFLVHFRAHVLAGKGYFERALNVWESCQSAALLDSSELGRSNLELYYGTMGLIHYQLGEPTPLSPGFETFRNTMSPFRSHILVSYGLAVIDHSKTLEDRVKGLELIREGHNFALTCSSETVAASFFGIFLGHAYLRAGAYDEGLEWIEQNLLRPVGGILGFGDMYRLKAELLAEKYDYNSKIRQEVLRNYQESFAYSYSVGANSSYLRTAISYANFSVKLSHLDNTFDIIDSLCTLQRALKQVDCSPKFNMVRKAFNLVDTLIKIQSNQQLSNSSPSSISSPSSSSGTTPESDQNSSNLFGISFNFEDDVSLIDGVLVPMLTIDPSQTTLPQEF